MPPTGSRARLIAVGKGVLFRQFDAERGISYGKIASVRTPRRRANAEYRTREHLTTREVERLIEATTSHRDATVILLAFRHGLRASELVDLRWDQVDFQTGVLHVRRAKAGTPATHPLTGRELRALRRLQRVDTRTIQAYLGHRDIKHTVRYTELSPVRFKGLWRD
jgi:integrase